jgi:hypothetical protein
MCPRQVVAPAKAGVIDWTAPNLRCATREYFRYQSDRVKSPSFRWRDGEKVCLDAGDPTSGIFGEMIFKLVK